MAKVVSVVPLESLQNQPPEDDSEGGARVVGVTPFIKSDPQKSIGRAGLLFEAAKTLTQRFTPMGQAWRLSRKAETTSRSGLKQLAEMVPEPQTTSIAANIALGTPRLAADVLAEFAPTFISPEAAVLSGAGPLLSRTGTAAIQSPATRKLAEQILKRTPEGVKQAGRSLRRVTSYRFGQPEPYKELAEGAKLAETQAVEQAIETARPLTKLTRKEQVLAGKYMKGEASDVPEAIKVLADKARSEFERLGQEAVDLGYLDEGTYLANQQTYLPRLYRAKEAQKVQGLFPNKPMRANLDRFKKRQDIPQEVREALGEIYEAGYPTAKGLVQLSQAVERGKMFRSVAQNAEWTTADAAAAAQRGFKQLPVTRRLGDLSGKFVHPEIARDVNEIVRVPGRIEQFYNKGLGYWKFGKVVANPATHFRNILSNSILMDLGGVGHLEQIRLLPRAADELLKKGRYFQEAKKAGLLGTEFVGGEVKAFRDAVMQEGFNPNFLQRAMGLGRRMANAAGKAYQGEEQVFKLAKFMKNRAKGMSVKAAAADAEKWLFNYEKVSPATQAIRKSSIGSPFITFTAKALPRVAEAAVKNPLSVAKYKMLFDAIERVGVQRGVIKEKDLETIKRNSRGTVVALPFKDKDGNNVTLDLSYILPWGDIGETGGMFGLPSALSPSGPLKSLADVGFNKSPYRGQEIYNKETDTRVEKAAKISDYLLKAASPSFMPGVNVEGSPFKGGYSFNRLMAAMQGAPYPRESPRGTVPSKKAAIAHTVFGLKTSSVNPAQMLADEILSKQRESQDLERELSRKLRAKGLSEAEKKRQINSFQKKVRRLWKTK